MPRAPGGRGRHPPALKKFGQHFLSDERILTAIVDALAPGPNDTVVEIGPGRGSLTDILAARCKKVIAVEIDRALAKLLRDRYVRVVRLRELQFDWNSDRRYWRTGSEQAGRTGASWVSCHDCGNDGKFDVGLDCRHAALITFCRESNKGLDRVKRHPYAVGCAPGNPLVSRVCLASDADRFLKLFISRIKGK